MALTLEQERRLIDRCLAGDSTAWEEFYSAYNDRMQESIRSLYDFEKYDPNLPEEIAARVWYVVVSDGGQLLDRFDPQQGCSLRAYLRVIARTVAGNYFRSERRRRRREHLAAVPQLQSERRGGFDPLASPEMLEFRRELTPREREFFDSFLVASAQKPNGNQFSDVYRRQLRSRIEYKLRKFLEREELV